MSEIEVKHLSKTFEQKGVHVDALKDINLTIGAGDIYGIIGMSGAGKSTLVRCLNFLERPTDGQVLIEGKDLGTLNEKELRKQRSDIAMIFQHFNLLMQKNVIDNICFPLQIQGVKKKEARAKARELLKTVGLEEKEKAYPAQLSGGQKQRVAIARALASNPKILLCDEATSALDPQTTASILELLKSINEQLQITIDDLEEKIASQNVKLFLLCSPHNPVGRVWTKEELQKLGELCDRYHVFVVSDEIHCDFAFPEHPHTIFAKACPQLEEKMILCTAPSKTFNLAGLQVSNIWVPGKEVRDRFKAEINAAGYSQLNALGLIACQAACENGGEWLEQCQAYLRENLKVLRSFLKERLPKIRLIEPEGTYFAWLDCSGLGLSDTALENLIAHQAKLWLDGGSVFDKKSGQFERIVLACTKKTLLQALTQLEAACRERNS